MFMYSIRKSKGNIVSFRCSLNSYVPKMSIVVCFLLVQILVLLHVPLLMNVEAFSVSPLALYVSRLPTFIHTVTERKCESKSSTILGATRTSKGYGKWKPIDNKSYVTANCSLFSSSKVVDEDTNIHMVSLSKAKSVINDLQNNQQQQQIINIVLLAGFESFNKELYAQAASSLPPSTKVNLQVFADSEIRNTGASVGVKGATEEDVTNPQFVTAMKHADIFIASLIFDYEDVVAVEALLDYVKGPRLLFECATELMTYNRVGTFSMEEKEGNEAGPPPAIKAVLSKFSSGKEEDKISGYLKLLKV